MRANLKRRLAALEAKAKPRMISTWVDFMTWLYEHEGDDGKLDVALSPELQELVEMASRKGKGLYGEVKDGFGPNN